MRITVKNDFHGTEAYANGKKTGIGQYRLNEDQIRTIKRKLCSVKGCTCSGRLGERGPQDYKISYDGFEYIQFHGPATKSEMQHLEREFQLMRGQYGENNQATIRALIRLEEAKEATAKSRSIPSPSVGG